MKTSKTSKILTANKAEQEYQAKIVATSENLKRYLNDALEIIRKSQLGEIPEDIAFRDLDDTEIVWGKLIVDDISPKKELLV